MELWNSHHEEEGKHKYCILYFIIITLICFLIGLNYIYTKDAFSENFQINLNSEVVCLNQTSDYLQCQKLFSENYNDSCSIPIDKLKNCEKGVENFIQKCEIYISELHLCLTKKSEDDCQDIYQDLLTCNQWTDIIDLTNITIFK